MYPFLFYFTLKQVFITTKVVSVNESAPSQLPDDKETEVTEEVVTFVRAQERQFAPQEIELLLDDSQDSLDASGRPVVVERRKSGNKVKKRRSFREKFSKRLSSGQ